LTSTPNWRDNATGRAGRQVGVFGKPRFCSRGHRQAAVEGEGHSRSCEFGLDLALGSFKLLGPEP
jgi:hypothetical protein